MEVKKLDIFKAGPFNFKSQNVKLPVKKYFNQELITVASLNCSAFKNESNILGISVSNEEDVLNQS
jgi:hypothetical protein